MMSLRSYLLSSSAILVLIFAAYTDSAPAKKSSNEKPVVRIDHVKLVASRTEISLHSKDHGNHRRSPEPGVVTGRPGNGDSTEDSSEDVTTTNDLTQETSTVITTQVTPLEVTTEFELKTKDVTTDITQKSSAMSTSDRTQETSTQGTTFDSTEGTTLEPRGPDESKSTSESGDISTAAGSTVTTTTTAGPTVAAPCKNATNTDSKSSNKDDTGDELIILGENVATNGTKKVTWPQKKNPPRVPFRRCRGVRHGRYCYVIKHDPASWNAAKKTCEKENSVLAIIRKKPVYRAVMKLVGRRKRAKEEFFWVGMQYATCLGLKKWVDQKQVEKSDYWSAFDILQEEGPVYKGCFGIDHDKGKLAATDCSTKYPYICFFDVTITNQTEFMEAPAPKQVGAFGTVAKENFNSGSFKKHHQIDIILTQEQEEIVKTGGDPSTATGAFRFEKAMPTHQELQACYEHQRHSRSRRKKRGATENAKSLWDSGVVDYMFHPEVTPEERITIKEAIALVQMKTCIRFKENSRPGDGIEFHTHEPKCSSWVGRKGGMQNIYVARRMARFDGCLHVMGSIIHEIFHALGFWHEHVRPDRNDYITINEANIHPHSLVNFDQQPSNSQYKGYAYDYESIMHYGRYAFALDPRIETITPNPRVWRNQRLGQRESPTDMDFIELNRLYNCNGVHMDGNWGLWSEWSQCTVSCGGGVQYRTRVCDNPAPENGGRDCQGQTSQSRLCRSDNCPEPEIMYSWLGCWKDDGFPEMLTLIEGFSSYLEEDHRIRSHRIRKCALAAKQLGAAIFALRFYGKCYAQLDVTMTGHFYGSSGPSDQCGQGGHGGMNEMDVYSVGNGPVQGQWAIWSDYTKCSQTCDGGVRHRQRKCNNPKPSSDDTKLSCRGLETEKSDCNAHPCPVNGGWSSWSAWSRCPNDVTSRTDDVSKGNQSLSCNDTSNSASAGSNATIPAEKGDYKFRYRSRTCNKPAPSYGGAQCQGELHEVEKCVKDGGETGGSGNTGTVAPPSGKIPHLCLIVYPDNVIATSNMDVDCSESADQQGVWNKAHHIELVVY